MIIGLHALDLVPKKAAGTAAGFTGFFGYVFGSAIAGTGVGWIADRWGWNGVFVTMVACCLLTIAFSAMTLGHTTQSASAAVLLSPAEQALSRSPPCAIQVARTLTVFYLTSQVIGRVCCPGDGNDRGRDPSRRGRSRSAAEEAVVTLVATADRVRDALSARRRPARHHAPAVQRAADPARGGRCGPPHPGHRRAHDRQEPGHHPPARPPRGTTAGPPRALPRGPSPGAVLCHRGSDPRCWPTSTLPWRRAPGACSPRSTAPAPRALIGLLDEVRAAAASSPRQPSKPNTTKSSTKETTRCRRRVSPCSPSSWRSRRPALAAETYNFDKSHTTVGFQVRHIFTMVSGRFTDYAGAIQVDRAKPESSTRRVHDPGDEHRHERASARPAPALRRLLRRGQPPDDQLQEHVGQGQRQGQLPRDGRPHDAGRHEAGHPAGDAARRGQGPHGQREDGPRDRGHAQPQGLRPRVEQGPRDGRRCSSATRSRSRSRSRRTRRSRRRPPPPK